MQNTIQKFTQSSIVFAKPSFLSENLKTWTSSNYSTVQYFLLKLRTRFLLTNVYKRVCGIFFNFIQILSYLQKIKKTQFLHTRFYLFIKNSRSKQNEKIPHTLLQTVENMCKISAKNIKLYGSWSLSMFPIFQTKNLVSLK